MPGLRLFKKSFYSHIGANRPIVAATINLGSTKGRGSSTRIFNYCNQHSANPSECINQFINIIPAPVAPAPAPIFTILVYNLTQGPSFTWDTVTFTRDTSLSNFSYTAITTSIPASIVPNPTNLIGVTIGNSVTSIGQNAFFSCSALISVSIPNSVTSIGISAFQSCSALISVSIPNSVIFIGAGAFNSCSGLTSVSIPNSVTSISAFAFLGCSALLSIIIPDSVTSIGQNAFNGCTSLTSITIPASVNTIDTDAFVNSGLTNNGVSGGAVTIPTATATGLGISGSPTTFFGATNVNMIYT